MIDTHCHLLPALDDGPANERAALAVASAMAASGVSTVLCTPHFSTRYPTSHTDALRAESLLVRAFEEEGVRLEIALAAEVSPERAVSAHGDDLTVRSIGGRFLLVELLHDTPAVSLSTICQRLAGLDLLPIFAHPERCSALWRSTDPLDDARREGALVQVVATSLTGRWGTEVEAAAWRIVDTGRADLLASDAHHQRHATVLARAGRLVSDRLGDAVRDELTRRRPELVLAGLDPELGAAP